VKLAYGPAEQSAGLSPVGASLRYTEADKLSPRWNFPPMNVSEAVLSRRSVRAFLDTPVPLETLQEIVQKAARAPSNSNIQPWLVRVVTGRKIAELKAAMRTRSEQQPPFNEFQYPIYPPELREPYLTRRSNCGERQYGKLGIARDDHAGRMNYVFNNLQFFGAPVGMFCFIEQDMGNSQWADLGCYVQTVMLLLREAGLDSCAQISWCGYATTVSEFFGVPANWTLYCGMSIGYADPDAPINTVVADRAPLDEFVKFVID
jgi:nitroreductase